MTRYVLGRLAGGLAVVIALTFVTFAVFQIIPWNPGYIVAGTTATPAQLRVADHELGVDQSLWLQYAHFLVRLLHANLGRSFTGESVNALIASAFPVTALLVAGGMIVMLALAIPLAIVSARRAGTAIDRAVLGVSILGIALHPFVVGILLKRFFGTDLHVLPFGGYCPLHHVGPPTAPPGSNLDAYQLQSLAAASHGGMTCSGAPWPWLWLQTMILPWVTFALFLLPFYVRILRTRLVESYSEPYVTAARAKGASETRIVVHHLLRSVFATTLAMVAIDVGTAITASIYIESTYHLPGLGEAAVTALGANGFGETGYDLPIMSAIVLVVAIAVVLIGLLADLAATRLDPHMQLGIRRRTWST